MKACVIWMHGLGATAQDMAALAAHPSLASLPLKHLFLDAPHRPVTINAGIRMPAWYDIYHLGSTHKEDQEGISQSATLIRKEIAKQQSLGFDSRSLFLAGFSQGGAMALYTALTADAPLGGIVALSAYLPLATQIKPTAPKTTPIFMGLGQFDTLLLPEWSKQSVNHLQTAGYTAIDLHQYPMGHAICDEEIHELASWFKTILEKGAPSV